MQPEPEETDSERRFRRYANWTIIVGTGIAASYFLCFLVYHSLSGQSTAENWLLQVLHEHYAATIGVPLSAMSAFCVVLLLRVVYTGPIEMEALGFKFRGASGPVVLWVFCFLAIIFGFWLLWGRASPDAAGC